VRIAARADRDLEQAFAVVNGGAVKLDAQGRSRLEQFADYVREGVWHIWIGFDHILFLVSLLLPSVFILVENRWAPATRFRDTFWDVFRVATSFTIAHSITLSLAALSIIQLPSRLVESCIALSVVLAALNNIWPLVHGRRWAVAFGFGLIHGFGFASVLADLQSPVRAIVTWTAHLRAQVSAASEPARALDAIEHNARAQDRIISSLLELSRVAAGRPAGERGGNGAPLLTGVRVLIVDDDPAARASMAQVLDIAGAQTRGAASSSEALDALGAFRPDVLLSDVHMHGGEGYFLIRALRALPAERGGCMRAAALTARGEAEDAGRAVAAGYDAQLAKPVEPVTLLATVARLAQPAGM